MVLEPNNNSNLYLNIKHLGKNQAVPIILGKKEPSDALKVGLTRLTPLE